LGLNKPELSQGRSSQLLRGAALGSSQCEEVSLKGPFSDSRCAIAVDRAAVIVSPYFPPSTLAGVHRARHLAKHLPAAGWHPIVLCVDEAFHAERLDPALAALVPSETEIVKVRALPLGLTRQFGIGEISLRAWGPLKDNLFRLLTTRRIDVVLITGSPYYPMLLARQIKRRFGVPVVLDFQDPWVSTWGRTKPFLSKAGIAHRLALNLEPRALRDADFVTSVSDIQNEAMRGRYPWLSAGNIAAIPIGGDPQDFDALRSDTSQTTSPDFLIPQRIHLSYVGTFLPRSGALLRVLFRAFRRLRDREPSLARQIRMNFVGTSNQPNDTTSFRVLPIAHEEGISESVHETPRRLPYLEALAVMSRSQGLLLVGSDEPHYTASKIYPALMSGRPYLSIFHSSSSAHAILSAAAGGCALAFANESELEALEGPLADGLYRLADAPRTFSKANAVAYAPFEARAVAATFAHIFDGLAASRAR